MIVCWLLAYRPNEQSQENKMAKRKKSGPKAPHCKRVSNGKGGTRKMCFNAKGKITSAAKVAAAKR